MPRQKDYELSDEGRNRWRLQLEEHLPAAYGERTRTARAMLQGDSDRGRLQNLASKLAFFAEGSAKGLYWLFQRPADLQRLEETVGVRNGYFTGLLANVRAARASVPGQILLPGFPEFGLLSATDAWVEPSFWCNKDMMSLLRSPAKDIPLDTALGRHGLTVVLATGEGASTILLRAAQVHRAAGWSPRFFDGSPPDGARGASLLVDGLRPDTPAIHQEALRGWLTEDGVPARPIVVALSPVPSRWPGWLPALTAPWWDPIPLQTKDYLDLGRDGALRNNLIIVNQPDRSAAERFIAKAHALAGPRSPMAKKLDGVAKDLDSPQWTAVLPHLSSMELLGHAVRDAMENGAPTIPRFAENMVRDSVGRLRAAQRTNLADLLESEGLDVLVRAAASVLSGAASGLDLDGASEEELSELLSSVPKTKVLRVRALLLTRSGRRLEEALIHSGAAERVNGTLVVRRRDALLAAAVGELDHTDRRPAFQRLLMDPEGGLALHFACEIAPADLVEAMDELEGPELLLALGNICGVMEHLGPGLLAARPSLPERVVAALILATPRWTSWEPEVHSSPWRLGQGGWASAASGLANALGRPGSVALVGGTIRAELDQLCGALKIKTPPLRDTDLELLRA